MKTGAYTNPWLSYMGAYGCGRTGGGPGGRTGGRMSAGTPGGRMSGGGWGTSPPGIA